jgi:hypothetical protein
MPLGVEWVVKAIVEEGTKTAISHYGRPVLTTLRSYIADVPLFVEHCEAVAAEIDVKLRWLGEQARRGLSVWSDALAVRHVMLEVACEPSVVGSL